MEAGGPVPEALIKLVVDQETRKRQLTKMTKSRQQLSSSSSSSSTPAQSSPLSLVDIEQQQPHPRQVNMVQPSSAPETSSPASSSQSSTLPASCSQSSMPQIHYRTSQNLLTHPVPHMSSTSHSLQHQLTPSSLFKRIPEKQSLNIQDSHMKSPMYAKPGSQSLSSPQFPVLIVESTKTPTSVASTEQLEHLFHSAKSELHLKQETNESFYTQPIFTRSNLKTVPEITMDLEEGVSPVSGFVTMSSDFLQFPATTSCPDLPSPLQEFITAHSLPAQGADQSVLNFGIFPELIATSTNQPTISSLPKTVLDNGNISFSDSISMQNVFRPPVQQSRKDTSSNPVNFTHSQNRMLGMTSTPAKFESAPSKAYDPNLQANNFSNLYRTNAINTPEASFENMPLASTSPGSLLQRGRSQPSLSSVSQPICSSALDIPVTSLPTSSATSGSAIRSTYSGQLSHLMFSGSDGTPRSSQVHESIPDWLSFLTDLESEARSATSPFNGGQVSGTIKPSTVTQRQQADPPNSAVAYRQHSDPSNSTFMNVPNIIDELLDSDDMF